MDIKVSYGIMEVESTLYDAIDLIPPEPACL